MIAEMQCPQGFWNTLYQTVFFFIFNFKTLAGLMLLRPAVIPPSRPGCAFSINSALNFPDSVRTHSKMKQSKCSTQSVDKNSCLEQLTWIKATSIMGAKLNDRWNNGTASVKRVDFDSLPFGFSASSTPFTAQCGYLAAWSSILQ